MKHIPQPHEIFSNEKGESFEMIALAEHSGTGEMLAVYQAMAGDYKIYAGPLALFMEGEQQEYRQEAQDSLSEPEKPEETPNLDPLVLEFLDADTYAERLNLLEVLHHRLTDEMVNVMAIATDLEVKPGNIEERFLELKSCLKKREQFECSRLR